MELELGSLQDRSPPKLPRPGQQQRFLSVVKEIEQQYVLLPKAWRLHVEQWSERLTQTLPLFTSVDVNDLRKNGFVYALASLHLLFYSVVLIYFLTSETMASLQRQYLSVTAPRTGEATCDKIPVSITGTFIADGNGVWSTKKNYDNTKALYQLSMTGTTITDEEYRDVVRKFATQLYEFGSKSVKTFDLLSTQIAWGLWRATDSESKVAFAPFAQLGQVFAPLASEPPVFSSAAGVCLNKRIPNPSFVAGGVTLSIAFPASPASPLSTSATPSPPTTTHSHIPSSAPTATDDDGGTFYEFCPDQISVKNHTFDLWVSNQPLKIDLVSAVTAFALNFGIIDTSVLTKKLDKIYDFGGTLGRVRDVHLVHDDYKDMAPVYCMHPLTPNVENPRVCLVLVGNSLAYPVLTSSLIEPDNIGRACHCPEDAKSPSCNDGANFQLTLLFSSLDQLTGTSADADVIATGRRLQRVMQDDTEKVPRWVNDFISSKAYAAIYWAKQPGFARHHYEEWARGQAMTADDDIAPTQGLAPFGSLFGPNYSSPDSPMSASTSLMSLQLSYWGTTADLNDQGVTLKSLASAFLNVSDYNERTNTTALVLCQDTIYQADALAKLGLTPPLRLVEPYLSCHATLTSAFFTSVGISAGTAALASSLFLSIALVFIVQYVNSRAPNEDGKIVPPALKALRLERSDRALRDRCDALSSELAELRRLVSSILPLEGLPGVGVGVDAIPDPSAYAGGDNPLHLSSNARVQEFVYRQQHQQHQQQQQQQQSVKACLNLIDTSSA